MQQDAADTVNKDARPEDCYILFSSHTDGWRLYELARDAGVKARISPTPRAARASCGVSLLASGVARLPRQLNARRDIFC